MSVFGKLFPLNKGKCFPGKSLAPVERVHFFLASCMSSPVPITTEALRDFVEDPSGHVPPEVSRKHVDAFEKAAAAVIKPMLTPWAGPHDVSTNTERLNEWNPAVLKWLVSVLPVVVARPFSRFDKKFGIREGCPYWLLQLTRAVLDWHIGETPVHDTFGNPSDAFSCAETAFLWFELPEAIANAAPFPQDLKKDQIVDALFWFYRDDKDEDEDYPSPLPWVVDFNEPFVAKEFFRAFSQLTRGFSGIGPLLKPRVVAHTCTLLSRLVVSVGDDGQLEATDDPQHAEFARKVLTAGIDLLPEGSAARRTSSVALSLLSPAVPIPAVPAPVGSPSLGGPLKRAREE